MPEKQSNIIAIVGAGNLGLALARLFAENGFQVLVGSRKPQVTRKRFAKLMETTPQLLKITDPVSAVKAADISLLTVSDAAIVKVCKALAGDFKAGSVVAHCSGALDSQALSNAFQQACAVCSLHPLNTFPNAEAALQLLSTADHGTYLYCEGDRKALLIATTIFEKVGFRSVEISRQAKPLYHAACVFACNYLTALMDVSLQTADAAQLDRKTFWNALQPLIRATLVNISEKGTAESLSGPIARGDDETVSKHLRALQASSKSLQLTYTDLGNHALKLAVERGQLSAGKIAALERALKFED